MAVGSSDYVSQSFRNRTSLVEDLLDNEGGYARGPERALIAALLFDGVQAYMNYGCTEEGRQRAKFREAYLWVHTRGSEYVFSFDSVCEALGVDAEFLRIGLANACNSQSYEWKRARRNF